MKNEFYMPAYWLCSGGKPVQFKDIDGNPLLLSCHDSLGLVYPKGIVSTLTVPPDWQVVWTAYHWEWLFRGPCCIDPPNKIQKIVRVDSIIGEYDGYILDKMDIYNGEHNVWMPMKKISKIVWGLNEPISQYVTEYQIIGNKNNSEKGSVVIYGDNVWEIVEELEYIENRFWDNGRTIWEGSILHLVEHEPNGNVIDYHLKLGTGLVRLKLCTREGIVLMEAGAV
jgi:hypothetical protein